MAPGPDGSIPEEVPDVTDEELYQECQVSLVDICGEKLPDIHDECTDEQIEFCAEAYEFVNPFITSCGFMDAEEVEQNSDRNLRSCCASLDEHMEEYMEAVECVKDLDLDDCDGFKKCSPEDKEDPDSSGYDEKETTIPAMGHRVLGAADAGLQEDSSDDKDSDKGDDTDSGCSVGPMPGKGSHGVLYIFISLMTLLFVHTRRRL